MDNDRGGTEYVLVVVVPDGCETVKVESEGIPTIVCGNKVDGLISSHEILDPSVRSSLLSALGQKELSVKNWAVVWGSNTDIQSKMYAPEVFVKDCPFVQQAATIGYVFPGSDKEHWMADIWERFPGGFRLIAEDRNRYMKRGGEGFHDFASNVEGFFELGVQQRKKFPELLYRGAKHNAVRYIKALAKDNVIRCIADLKEKLKKLEGKLEKVSEEERLKK